MVQSNILQPMNPAQKPLALIRMIITRHSNPSDNILDLCSGTGTSAVAAVSLERNIVCVERDQTQAAQIPLRVEGFDYESLVAPADPFAPEEDEDILIATELNEQLNQCGKCKRDINPDESTTCTECQVRFCSDCMAKFTPITCACSNVISN